MTEATEKAGAIERDIVETQNNISDTVEKLKERLSPQSLLNSVLGDDKQGFDQVVNLAKRNPFAVALIGAGVAWLATGKEAKMPSLGKSRDDNVRSDPHRAYVDHMARIEIRDGETTQQFQRRRDLARSRTISCSSAARGGVRFRKLPMRRGKACGPYRASAYAKDNV